MLGTTIIFKIRTIFLTFPGFIYLWSIPTVKGTCAGIFLEFQSYYRNKDQVDGKI